MNRNRYQQDEDKRQKEALIKFFLKEKCRRESQFRHLNDLKLSSQWRLLQREAKSRELREDVATMQDTFRQLVSHKDAMLVLLREELGQADRMAQVAFKGHALQVENLIDLKNRRAQATCEHFVWEMESLSRHYGGHENQMQMLQKYNLEEIRAFGRRNNRRHLNLEAETANKYLEMEEEIIAKGQDERQRLRTEAESRTAELWQQMQNTLKSCWLDTKDSQDTFHDLELRNKDCLKDIEEQRKKIRRLNDSISYLKETSRETEEYFNESINEMNYKKHLLRHTAEEVQKKLEKIKKTQRQELGMVVQWTDEAIEKMKSVAEKTDRILKIHSQCVKIEPEFVREPVADQNQNQILTKDFNMSSLEDVFEEIGGDVNHIHVLDHIWRKYNRMVSATMDIKQELVELQNENKLLKTRFKEKLLSMSTTDSIWNDPSLEEFRKDPLLAEDSVLNKNATIIDARDIVYQKQVL